MALHGIALAALAAVLMIAPPLRAQGGGAPQPPHTQPPVAPYRAPQLALVQPAPGVAVPQDRPVVVFRFSPGEPADPLDLASFAVAVDGVDRTALFQVSASEAWGPLAPPGPPNIGGEGAALVAPGEHRVSARICSSRGACTTIAAAISVVPGHSKPTDQAEQQNRRQRLLDLLLTAARKLLVP
jgi:hypothetical protein